jgi:hypothetical protein
MYDLILSKSKEKNKAKCGRKFNYGSNRRNKHAITDNKQTYNNITNIYTG